jgi:hypothetical protein
VLRKRARAGSRSIFLGSSARKYQDDDDDDDTDDTNEADAEA